MVGPDVLPQRPRLAQGVWARRHVIDGEQVIVLKGPGLDGVMQIGTAAWRALTFADGTRDHEGLRAACERDGVTWTAGEIHELVSSLHEVGFLAEGPAPLPAATATAVDPADRELEVLPDFALVCDGGGSCCRIYDTVVFRPQEARHATPEGVDERFTPYLGGQLDRSNWTACHVDGRCAFLGEDLRCELHRKGGPTGKPLGCRTYPITLTDDGECLRVSVGPECACIFASIGREDGDPLVPAGATTSGDLEPGIVADVLPETIDVSPSRSASRAELRRWSVWLAQLLETTEEDLAALVWGLAESVEAEGLSMRTPAAMSPSRAWLSWLGAAARRAAEDDAAWRGATDLRRRATAWVATALDGEIDVSADDRAAERMYLRSLNHAYRLAIADRSLADGLRDRAVRILAARAMRRRPPEGDDPSYRFPLALLEAVMRDGNMARYTPASNAE